MRIVHAQRLINPVRSLVIDAALRLRPDVKRALQRAVRSEKSKRARMILRVLLENAAIASKNRIPLCQDTGMAIVYCDIGRDMVIKGNLDRAINEGIRQGTKEGYLRRSIVRDPLDRVNTGTNTPVIIHYGWRPGKKIKVTVFLKGFGCENKGQVVMFNPTATYDDIQREALRIIKEAGPHACPPYIIGVGIGGTMDKAAALAKESLLAPLGKRNGNSRWARFERSLIRKANQLNIGPLGLGGKTTVLDVKVKVFPTHIAGLPLAVNISCHALRSKSIIF